jgi:hypothetical protein
VPTDPAHDASSLALDADVMRQLGYRTIDMLVNRITAPKGPVVRLLRMDWHLTDQLMKDAPRFAEMIEQVARERLGTL